MATAATSSSSNSALQQEQQHRESWGFYQLPFFYTLQPNPPTRQKQLALWADLLVQTALRQCSLGHPSMRAWEAASSGAAGNSAAAAGPPADARAVSAKLNALPNDKCPFVALFTAEDPLFANAAINRRLPKAAIPLVFQAAMLMYPSLCVSNVPVTHPLAAPGDAELYKDPSAAAAAANAKKSHHQSAAAPDQMAGWLSSLFGTSRAAHHHHNQKATAAAAAAHQQQQQQQAAEEPEEVAEQYWLAVFANDGGHTSVMSDHVLRWVMDMGGGLTTANLKKNGVVTTFDEMATENALVYTPHAREGGGAPVVVTYAPPAKGMPERLVSGAAGGSAATASASTTTTRGSAAAQAAALRLSNGVTNEHVLRLLLHFYQHSPAATPVTQITLFNLDGSDQQPYEGVKFGGEGV